MKEVRYNNIISELKALFPEFTNDAELRNAADDEPGLYLTFLISYVSERWNDRSIQDRLAKFMDNMAKSQDAAVKNTFSDFALDFYLHFGEHKMDIRSFMTNMLLPETRNFVQNCADYWYKANNAIKESSR
jgi:hypothetical protein